MASSTRIDQPQHIIVREFARLTTASVADGSLDEAQISHSAFEWLCAESARLRRSGASLVQLDNHQYLRLDNYVGVIETPCGTRIEILPKWLESDDDVEAARALLRRMLRRCLRVDHRESSPTTIHAYNEPLTEWVMREFLDKLDSLLKRGLRFEYRAVQEEQRFLRGRLDVTRQMRQPPGRQHVFQIEHDIFDADRPENRLIRSALDRVCRSTRNADNWRLSHELAVQLSSIPASPSIFLDFGNWRNDRLLAHYKPVRPWCELILESKTPLSALGAWHGNSLLFPMEKLFERYVEFSLRDSLPGDAILTCEARGHHLVHHQNEPLFLLKPDFLLQYGTRTWVIDAKWKRLNEEAISSGETYGISQADLYQLFAYGHKYLGAVGELLLIFPRTRKFNNTLPPFQFSPQLTLWVVPFDLERGLLLTDKLPMRAHSIDLEAMS